MPNVTLQFPVRTLENELLFSAGALLTKEKLDIGPFSKRAYSYQTYSLLLHGSVKKDCLNFLSRPPYDVIFSDKKQVKDLFGLLEKVRLFTPVLQSLDYFRQHDFNTYAHILMVFALSTLLAKDLIPNHHECIELSSTGPTHDIGKVCVPLHILKKKKPLTQTERGFIEHHAAAGYVLLHYYCKDTQPLACEVALNHHERKDGSGYPRGMRLQHPLIEIIAVSDIYDALLIPRPYRSTAYDNRTALEEITAMAAQDKIGWEVVKALIAHNRKAKFHYKEIKISAEKRGTPPVDNVYGVIADQEKESSNG